MQAASFSLPPGLSAPRGFPCAFSSLYCFSGSFPHIESWGNLIAAHRFQSLCNSSVLALFHFTSLILHLRGRSWRRGISRISNHSVCMGALPLSRVQLSATPWSVPGQFPVSMGFPWQEYWSGLPFPCPRDIPNPGIEPAPPALHTDSLSVSHQGIPSLKKKKTALCLIRGLMSKDCSSRKGFSSVQLLSRVRLFPTPWTRACQASLSTSNSSSSLRPLSMESGLAGWFLPRIPGKDQEVAAEAL